MHVSCNSHTAAAHRCLLPWSVRMAHGLYPRDCLLLVECAAFHLRGHSEAKAKASWEVSHTQRSILCLLVLRMSSKLQDACVVYSCCCCLNVPTCACWTYLLGTLCCCISHQCQCYKLSPIQPFVQWCLQARPHCREQGKSATEHTSNASTEHGILTGAQLGT